MITTIEVIIDNEIKVEKDNIKIIIIKAGTKIYACLHIYIPNWPLQPFSQDY